MAPLEDLTVFTTQINNQQLGAPTTSASSTQSNGSTEEQQFEQLSNLQQIEITTSENGVFTASSRRCLGGQRQHVPLSAGSF